MTKDEAIKQIEWVKKRISDITYSPESFEALNLAIKALEERPTGEWIVVEKMLNIWACSNCKEEYCSETGGTPSEWDYNYCPNCGAKMRR